MSDTIIFSISLFIFFLFLSILISILIERIKTMRKIKKFFDTIEIEFEKAMKEKLSPDEFGKKFIKNYPQFEELFNSFIREVKIQNILDNTLDLLDMLREKLKKFDDESEFDEKLKGGKKP